MTIDEIIEVGDRAKIIKELKKDSASDGFNPKENRNPTVIAKYIDYYKGENNARKVDIDPSRQDYQANVPKFDSNNVQEKDSKGNPVFEALTVIRTRNHLATVNNIIETGGAMLFGEPVTMTAVIKEDENEDKQVASFETIKRIWRQDIQMDSLNLEVFKRNSIESKCAVVFQFADEDSPTPETITPMILCKENGDDIWFHKDDLGKIDSMLRVYTKRVIIDGEFDDVEVTELFTAKERLTWTGDENESVSEANPYETNIFVPLDQEFPEYWQVKDTLDSQEIIHSRIADINIKIGSEMLVMQGAVKYLPSANSDVKIWAASGMKNDSGTITYGDIKSIRAEGATDAQDKEIERNWEEIFKNTWTDLSKLREQVKGSAASGYAIKLALTDVWVKRAYRGIQYMRYLKGCSKIIRAMLNKLDAGAGYNEMSIDFIFNSILPDDVEAKINQATSALLGGVWDSKTAIQFVGYGNSEQIKEAIEEEAKNKSNRENSLDV